MIKFQSWTKNRHLRKALKQAISLLVFCVVFWIGVRYYVSRIQNKSLQKQAVVSQSFTTPVLSETKWTESPSHARSVKKKAILEYGKVNHITGFSYAEILPSSSVQLHNHESKDEVFHVVEGEGKVILQRKTTEEEVTLPIKQGSTIVLYAGEMHAFVSGSVHQ